MTQGESHMLDGMLAEFFSSPFSLGQGMETNESRKAQFLCFWTVLKEVCFPSLRTHYRKHITSDLKNTSFLVIFKTASNDPTFLVIYFQGIIQLLSKLGCRE